VGKRTTRGGAPIAISDADRKVAKQMSAYGAQFAKTGDPNGSGLPRWPAYTPQNDAALEFTMNDGAGGARAVQGREDGAVGCAVRRRLPSTLKRAGGSGAPGVSNGSGVPAAMAKWAPGFSRIRSV